MKVVLLYFSARDEYKIKYEQLEREVLLLNERVRAELGVFMTPPREPDQYLYPP